MTIDDYIKQRNEIQLTAEALGEEAGKKKWIQLGVANRHIDRVLSGEFPLIPAIEKEIQDCLQRAKENV